MPRSSRFVLITLCAFVALCNLLWYSLGSHQQHWDSAIHLTESLNANRIGEDSTSSIVKQALMVSWYYPPFVSYVAIPFYKLFGETDVAALLVMTFFFLVLIISVYGICSKLFDEHVGLLAALLIAVCPIVIEFSHTFMLDLPQAALVALVILSLLHTSSFQRMFPSLLFGAALGMGLLTKWTIVTFVLVPITIEFIRGLRAASRKRTVVLNALLAAGAACIIIAPWYLVHAIQIATSRTGFLTDEERTPLQSYFYYLNALPGQLSLPLLLVFGVGIVLFVIRQRDHRSFLILWFIGSYVLTSLIAFKQPRHSIALLIPLAVMTAAGFGTLQHKRIIVSVMVAVLTLFLIISFTPQDSFFGQALSRPLFSWPMISVHGPTRADWHQEDIVNAVERDRVQHNRPYVNLRVIPDHIYCNNAASTYLAKLRRYPIAVAGTTGFPLFTDYVLVKSPDVGVDSPDHERERLTQQILADTPSPTSMYHPVGRWLLPDKSEATLLRVEPLQEDTSFAKRMLEKTEALADQFIHRYIKPESGYHLTVTPYSLNETCGGHFKRILVEAETGEAGDFTFNPLGLKVRNIELEIGDVRINPHELLTNNQLQMLSVGTLRVNKFTVAADDLKRYAEESSNGNVHIEHLTIDGGMINLRGESNDMGRTIDLGVQLTSTEAGNLVFHIEHLNIGSIHIPAALVNTMMLPFNPLLSGLASLREVRIGNIRLEHQQIAIGNDVQ